MPGSTLPVQALLLLEGSRQPSAGYAAALQSPAQGQPLPSHIVWEAEDRGLGQAMLEEFLGFIKAIQTLRQSGLQDPLS